LGNPKKRLAVKTELKKQAQMRVVAPTELGRLEDGMTAVMHEMIALKCAGFIISGITDSQKP